VRELDAGLVQREAATVSAQAQARGAGQELAWAPALGQAWEPVRVSAVAACAWSASVPAPRLFAGG